MDTRLLILIVVIIFMIVCPAALILLTNIAEPAMIGFIGAGVLTVLYILTI